MGDQGGRAPTTTSGDSARVRAFAVAGIGTWEWDPHDATVTFDDACARLFGRRQGAEHAGFDALLHFIHPEDLTLLETSARLAARAGRPQECTLRAQFPDGMRHLLCRSRGESAGGRTRVVGAVLDVTELRSADAAKLSATQRMASLSAVALSLNAARSVEDVVHVVMGGGFKVLGAARGVLAVTDATGRRVRVWRSGDDVDDDIKAHFTDVSIDTPLPSTYAARTGRALFLHDAAANIDMFPDTADLTRRVNAEGVAALPLAVPGRALGALMISWREPRTFPPEDRDLAFALAAQTAQALDRVLVGAAERRVSESLQRSLLTLPPRLLKPGPPGCPDDLRIAVRYRPAAHLARVGGDWYDVFTQPGGRTVLVLGDVMGHDVRAAGVMGQVRNLLRGIAYDRCAEPSEVLRRVDAVMAGLDVTTPATSVVLRIARPAADHGARDIQWSNAGHLPPVLLGADGSVEVLRTPPELLLGVDSLTERTAHDMTLSPGATLLVFTDGLIERRDEDLECGLDRLCTVLRDLAGHPLEETCDELLERLVPERCEDDVALVALRLEAETQR